MLFDSRARVVKKSDKKNSLRFEIRGNPLQPAVIAVIAVIAASCEYGTRARVEPHTSDERGQCACSPQMPLPSREEECRVQHARTPGVPPGAAVLVPAASEWE